MNLGEVKNLNAENVRIKCTDTYSMAIGGIVGYNTYRNSTGPDCYGPSLERYLENRKLFFTFLIGIRRK
jgi:hypothetical protein